MSAYTATVRWKRGADDALLARRYCRAPFPSMPSAFQLGRRKGRLMRAPDFRRQALVIFRTEFVA